MPFSVFFNRKEVQQACYTLFFSFGLSTAFLLYIIIARLGFTIPWKELLLIYGVALFSFITIAILPLFPKTPNLLNKSYYTIIFILLFYIICSYIPYSIYIMYIIAFLGIIAAIGILKIVLPQLMNIFGLTFLVCALLVILYILGYSTHNSQNYFTPLLLEQMTYGNANKDLLFHMGNAQMIKTYGFPTNGLDGLLYTSYHYGSHYILARCAILFKTSINFSYNFIYPIIFIPIYFLTLITTANHLSSLRSPNLKQKDYLFWVVFAVVIIRFMPYSYNSYFGMGDSYILSQSYLFGLIGLYILISFIAVLFKKEKLLLVEVIILYGFNIFLFYAKVSIGILCVPILTWIVIRMKCYHYLKHRITWVIYICTSFVSYKLTSESNTIQFSFLHFPLNYGKISSLSYFYYIYFATPLIYIYVRFFYFLKINSLKQFILLFKKTRTLDIELLFIGVFISSLPGLLLAIPAGSAGYFSNVPVKVGTVLLLSLSPAIYPILKKKLQKLSFFRKSGLFFLLLPLCTTLLFNTFLLLYQGFLSTIKIRYNVAGKNVRIRDSIYSLQEEIERHPNYQWLKKLEKLDEQPLSEKKNQVLYIPKSDSSYYKYLKPNWASSFIAPALSGLTMIDGLPYLNDLNQHYKRYNSWVYGFKPYMERGSIPVNNIKDRMKVLGLEDKELILMPLEESNDFLQ